jgi:hypothetical protein
MDIFLKVSKSFNQFFLHVWHLAFVLLDYFSYSCKDNSTITYELDWQEDVPRTCSLVST